MRRWLAACMALTAVTGLSGCEAEVQDTAEATSAPPAEASATPTAAADSAEDVQPLTEGAPAPAAILRTGDDEPVDLGALYARQPTMLLFYRGGWCPYCNQQLGHLAEADAAIAELGIQTLAISPDRPQKLRESESEARGEHRYRLLSDSRMELAKAFGLAFRVPAETVEQYREYGIDLADASGEDHHLLPVPAVYLIDRDGVIRFAHWDADYKNRLSAEALIEAARQIAR